jgi:hypothetical protein
MGTQDRPQPRRRSRAQSAKEQSEDAAAPSESARVPTSLFSGDRARIWLLPAAHGETLAVAGEPDIRALAESLRVAPPEMLAARVEAGDESRAAARAWKYFEPRFIEQMHESVFDFGKRMMVSFAWLVVSFAAARMSGEVETLAILLGVLGLGFLGYTLARYGYGVVRWHNRRVDASHAFSQATIQKDAFAARLAHALELRTRLKPEERGKSPDDELLDTNAYRKLIGEGMITTKELVALGEAINATLRFQDSAGNPRRISEVAQQAGLSAETAIFYRDLASAASEIKLTDATSSISQPL